METSYPYEKTKEKIHAKPATLARELELDGQDSSGGRPGYSSNR